MSHVQPTEPRYDSLFDLITQRLYWFFIGPMFLVLMLLGVLNDENGRQLGFSIAYLVGLAGLPLSRWLEIRTGNAVTADGQPATWQHFWKYTIVSLSIGIVALIAANVWVRM